MILTNELLNLITNKSLKNGDNIKDEEISVKIEDFIEVDPKEFIKTLKKLSNVNLD